MALDESSYRQLLQNGARRWHIQAADLAPPRAHRIALRGLNFRYLDWGKVADRPRLLFLHGGGLTAQAWDLICLGLRNEYHCIALDARGHGDSDWAPNTDYHIATQRDDVLAFLDALELEQVALVGHSMGGFTAMSLSAHVPQRIRALTLLDIGPEPREEGTRQIRDLVTDQRPFVSLDDAVAHVLAHKPGRSPDSIRRSLTIALRQGEDGLWRWKYDPARYAFLRSEAFISERRALWAELRRVQCPAQVIRGELSRVFLAEDAVAVAQAMRGRWLVAPGAGHNVHSENPPVVISAIRELMG